VAKIAFTYSGNVYDAAPAGTVDFPLVTPGGKAIPYLEKTHIHVYSSADAGVTWKELTRPAEWDFDSTGRIARLKTAVTPDWVMVRRITPYDSKYTTFQDSSLLTAEQLNEGEDFSMFVDQEISDLSGLASLSSLDQLITTAMQKAGKWVADDAHLATTGALSERFDVYVQDTKPADPPITEQRQAGKIWIDDGTLQFSYWEPAARAWVNLSTSGPQGPPGPNVFYGPAFPPEPNAYGLWYDTNKKELRIKYDDGTGVQWVLAGGVAPPTGQLVAGNGVAANSVHEIQSIDQGVI